MLGRGLPASVTHALSPEHSCNVECFHGHAAPQPLLLCRKAHAVLLYQHSDVAIAAFVRGEAEGALHDDATWLLDFYETFKEFVTADVTENALTSLAQVLGRFGARPASIDIVEYHQQGVGVENEM